MSLARRRRRLPYSQCSSESCPSPSPHPRHRRVAGNVALLATLHPTRVGLDSSQIDGCARMRSLASPCAACCTGCPSRPPQRFASCSSAPTPTSSCARSSIPRRRPTPSRPRRSSTATSRCYAKHSRPCAPRGSPTAQGPLRSPALPAVQRAGLGGAARPLDLQDGARACDQLGVHPDELQSRLFDDSPVRCAHTRRQGTLSHSSPQMPPRPPPPAGGAS